jgi:ribonuclease P protein component
MLPKKHRLKTKTEFDLVYKQGKSLRTRYFGLYYLSGRERKDIPMSFELPRFGFVASKKVGGAVKRNRAKRLLREAVRDELPKLSKNFEAVFIAYDSAPGAEFPKISEEVKKAFNLVGLYAPSNL